MNIKPWKEGLSSAPLMLGARQQSGVQLCRAAPRWNCVRAWPSMGTMMASMLDERRAPRTLTGSKHLVRTPLGAWGRSRE